MPDEPLNAPEPEQQPQAADEEDGGTCTGNSNSIEFYAKKALSVLSEGQLRSVCVCVCACAHVRVCVRVRVCACVCVCVSLSPSLPLSCLCAVLLYLTQHYPSFVHAASGAAHP